MMNDVLWIIFNGIVGGLYGAWWGHFLVTWDRGMTIE